MSTPANAHRVADKLSHMRGAAMKVGRLLSMDAGDLLPPELGAIAPDVSIVGKFIDSAF